MQKGMDLPCFKSNPQFYVKDIFLDNYNWDVYKRQHKDELRQVEVDEVEIILHCKDGSRGFFIIVQIERILELCILIVLLPLIFCEKGPGWSVFQLIFIIIYRKWWSAKQFLIKKGSKYLIEVRIWGNLEKLKSNNIKIEQ